MRSGRLVRQPELTAWRMIMKRVGWRAVYVLLTLLALVLAAGAPEAFPW
jgi:hypothetical protein